MQTTAATETAAPIRGATPPRHLTIEHVAQVRPAWTPAALRDLKFRAFDRMNSRGERIAGNGTGRAGVWIQIGRRVLVDIEAFDRWVESHRKAS
jgi:hypothetical protein